MDGHRFDDLTRRLAGGVTRRGFLKTALGSAGAALLARAGIGEAAAAARACRRDRDCSGGTPRCETTSGICCAPRDGTVNRTCCRLDQVESDTSILDGTRLECCPAGSDPLALGSKPGRPRCCAEGTTCRAADKCCRPGERCSAGEDGGKGRCCPAGSAAEVCGGRCCGGDDVCAAGDGRKRCCVAGSSASLCGGRCCTEGHACCNGRCCPIAGGSCADDGTCNTCDENSRLCGDACCPQGRECCNHVCCTSGSTCRNDGTCTMAPVNVSVPSAVTQVGTGVTVSAGDSVSISAEGLIDYGSGLTGSSCQCPSGPCIGPEGCAEESAWAFADRSDVTAPAGSLVGRIGDGTPFFIGAGTTVTASTSGEVILAVNDFPAEKGNNSGGFSATVSFG